MTEEKSMGNLAERILFLTVSCSRFGNVRKSNVELNTTATHSRFATNKKLLVSPELKQIAKRDEEVKHQVERFLLPYKVGCSILPCASAPTVRTILNDYKKVERPALVQAFKSAYVAQVASAQVELKDEFVANEYDPDAVVSANFDFDFDMFSMDLSDEMKEQAHEKIMEAAASIADALTVAAHGLVSKLADSLSSNSDGKAKKIYDSQFTKLQEVFV